jgi:hypothetical protein
MEDEFETNCKHNYASNGNVSNSEKLLVLMVFSVIGFCSAMALVSSLNSPTESDMEALEKRVWQTEAFVAHIAGAQYHIFFSLSVVACFCWLAVFF